MIQCDRRSHQKQKEIKVVNNTEDKRGTRDATPFTSLHNANDIYGYS